MVYALNMGWGWRSREGGVGLSAFGKNPFGNAKGPSAGQGDESKKTMAQEKEDVQELKAVKRKDRAANTLHLSLLLHFEEDIRTACVRMYCVARPLDRWQSWLMEFLISVEASQRYLVGMAWGDVPLS